MVKKHFKIMLAFVVAFFFIGTGSLVEAQTVENDTNAVEVVESDTNTTDSLTDNQGQESMNNNPEPKMEAPFVTENNTSVNQTDLPQEQAREPETDGNNEGDSLEETSGDEDDPHPSNSEINSDSEGSNEDVVSQTQSSETQEATNNSVDEESVTENINNDVEDVPEGINNSPAVDSTITSSVAQTEPVEQTEQAEETQPVEQVEQIEQAQPIESGQTEQAEQVEESTEPAESVEPVEEETVLETEEQETESVSEETASNTHRFPSLTIGETPNERYFTWYSDNPEQGYFEIAIANDAEDFTNSQIIEGTTETDNNTQGLFNSSFPDLSNTQVHIPGLSRNSEYMYRF